jgi:hypothetical protein
MTIQLTVSVRIAGVVQTAGTQLTLSVSEEADFVHRGVATFVGDDPATKEPRLIVNSRDSAGRVTGYSLNDVAYAVTYTPENFGVATISGGGRVTTISYNAQGQVTDMVNV